MPASSGCSTVKTTGRSGGCGFRRACWRSSSSSRPSPPGLNWSHSVWDMVVATLARGGGDRRRIGPRGGRRVARCRPAWSAAFAAGTVSPAAACGAAVRFGSGGVGLSVLATVLVAVVSALYGDGLFHAFPPEVRIDMLQVFLISATVPLMCVGALVEERQRVAGALQASDTLKASILDLDPQPRRRRQPGWARRGRERRLDAQCAPAMSSTRSA